jgi:transmembrane sensor
MSAERPNLARYVQRPMEANAYPRQWLSIEERRALGKSHRRRRSFAAAALLAGVLLAGVGARLYFGAEREPVVASLAPGEVLQAGARAMDLRLPDGSQLALTAGAQLVTEAVAADALRFSLRRGGASFDVTRNPARTFQVVAGNVSVRVIGTRFSLRREAERVHVEVARGLVEVRTPDETRRLAAGESWRIGRRSALAPDGTSEADDEPQRTLAEAEHAQPRTGARELFEQARAARNERRYREAAERYAELLRHFPRDGRAGVAALELGRLRLDALGDAAGAIAPLKRASSSAPGESLREDATARLVEAYESTGQLGACRAMRARYLEQFPEGVHAAAVMRRCGP